jgi:hypothetical protein
MKGEVFDHGIDAINCQFGAILQAAAGACGFGVSSTAIILIATTTFFFTTWVCYKFTIGNVLHWNISIFKFEYSILDILMVPLKV